MMSSNILAMRTATGPRLADCKLVKMATTTPSGGVVAPSGGVVALSCAGGSNINAQLAPIVPPVWPTQNRVSEMGTICQPIPYDPALTQLTEVPTTGVHSFRTVSCPRYPIAAAALSSTLC